jgi:hypothetical protein
MRTGERNFSSGSDGNELQPPVRHLNVSHRLSRVKGLAGIRE